MVQLDPFAEVRIENERAYADSQSSTTEVTVALAPRSTCNHCGSLNALDQRVPALPSTAFAAVKAADSVDDAVAGLPWDSRVSAADAEEAATHEPSEVSYDEQFYPARPRRLRPRARLRLFARRPKEQIGRPSGDNEH